MSDTDNVGVAPSGSGVKHTYGSLSMFNQKTSWKSYKQRLELFFEANNVTCATKKRAIFLTSVGEETYEVVSALAMPKEPGELSYDVIITKLTDYFNPTPNEIVQRYHFNQRVQRKDETLSHFVADLRKLSEHCNFTELDKMLRDRIVCGVLDEGLQRKLFAEPDLDYKRAVELATAAETATKNVQMVRMTGEGYATGEVHATGEVPSGKNHKCFRCNGTTHGPGDCQFKNARCYWCKRVGHVKYACSKRRNNENANEGRKSNVVQNIELEEMNLYELNNVISAETPQFTAKLKLNGCKVEFQVDSGAVCTVISESTYISLGNCRPALVPAEIQLQTWSKQNLSVLGQAKISVGYKRRVRRLRVHVVRGGVTNLLGRDWFQPLGIALVGINQIENDTCLKAKYKSVFGDNLGVFKGGKVSLELKDDASPKFFKSRPVPLALRPAVEQEIDRLVDQEILEPVNFSKWATPVVAIRKKDGSIRLCGDYRATVNVAVKTNSYPLPTINEVLSIVNRARVMSKLDLAQAYQQLEVDQAASEILTINTLKGLFKVKRLPFGISAAPGLFQRVMDQVLKGIPGVMAYLDDIFVFAESVGEHDARLEEVLKRLQECNLTVNKPKCVFKASEMDVLGFTISDKGVSPSLEKVKAIHCAPAPTNKQQLQAFLGLVNFYNRFLPNKATVAEELHRLLDTKKSWSWGDKQQKAFEQLKSLLKSDAILTHYDANKELVLSCDASPYGVAAVLAHRESDGSEWPIAFCSRTLGKAERNYAHIDREALSIINGMKHFHQYVWGRQVTIITDHKPLLGLFNPTKQMKDILSPRMTRWCLMLSGYIYSIEYREGQKHGNADGLSRLPLEGLVDEPCAPGDILLLESVNQAPIHAKNIQQLTAKDQILSRVFYWALHGWPAAKVDDIFRPFVQRKHEISVHNGCLLWGNRVIVPQKGRTEILQLLHANHPGIVAMKGCARSYVWWPQIDQQIENVVKSCEACQQQQNNPPKAPRQGIERNLSPWRTLHVDHAGPFKGNYFLIVVDAMTKWLEVVTVPSTNSQGVIQALRKLFATFGVPDEVVSDNGTGFKSQEIRQFYEVNGIKDYHVAPYHPSSNGQAERMVQTTKRDLEKLSGNVQLQLARFLFKQHNTIHAGTGKTPSELMFGRKLRSVLDKIHPDNIRNAAPINNSQTKLREFEQNDEVYIRNFGNGPKWLPGRVAEVTGPASYVVEVDGNKCNRHVDQVRERVTVNTEELGSEREIVDNHETEVVPDERGEEVPLPVDEATVTGRPVRERKIPDKLRGFVLT